MFPLPKRLHVRALIIEDDSMIRRLVEVQLSREAIDVTTASDVGAGRAALEVGQFDLIILDLTLPDGSGLDMLKLLRQQGSTAHVIVLSGAVGELDRVGALQSGADDYVSKPFFARELAARALAVRRRLEWAPQSRLQYNWLEIDLEARMVTAHGSQIDLTTKEFDLMAYVACRPNQVFSREELLQSVWQSTSASQRATTVTEHVRRLRAKLGDETPPRLIISVRSIGYRFDPPGATSTAPRIERSSPAPDGALDRYWVEPGEDVLGTRVVDLVSPDETTRSGDSVTRRFGPSSRREHEGPAPSTPPARL